VKCASLKGLVMWCERRCVTVMVGGGVCGVNVTGVVGRVWGWGGSGRGVAAGVRGELIVINMGLAAGLRASVRIVVGEGDTAVEVGSGDVPVLATPRLLALAEAAAVAAVTPHLAPGQTSVGTGVSLEHRRASPVGAEILVDAELTEVDGRRLVFSFIARQSGHAPEVAAAGAEEREDEGLVVGAGTLERVVVDRAKFLAHNASPS
jgi:fluoroacetyl-CoA thioesterase